MSDSPSVVRAKGYRAEVKRRRGHAVQNPWSDPREQLEKIARQHELLTDNAERKPGGADRWQTKRAMGVSFDQPVLEAAELLIEQRGCDALAQAIWRADWCARARDKCGVALWHQVAEAILEQQSPGSCESRELS